MQLISPRLNALYHSLQNNEPDALENFWEEMIESGTPLIEPHDDSGYLVTMLWRGDDQTDNVLLIGALAGQSVSNGQLYHLEGTDVWYRTFRLRADTRTVYYLSPNNPIQSWSNLDSTAEWEAQMQLWRTDPLNPDRFRFPTNSHSTTGGERWASLLEMPEAPPQKYSRLLPDVPAGTVTEAKITSTQLENTRTYWVYTPPRYEHDNTAHPLLLVLDGSAYHSSEALIPLPIILDNLIAMGEIPPLVAVMIDHPPRRRETELSCSEPFARFLVEELMPHLRQNYRLTTDPDEMILAGNMLGGLAATYIAMTYAEYFGNVLSQSGRFAWRPNKQDEYEWLTRQFVSRRQLPLRFYLDVGLLENDSPGEVPGNLVANRHLRNVLQAREYEVNYKEFSGGPDYVCWRETLSDGLIALIGFISDEPTLSG